VRSEALIDKRLFF